MRKNKKNRLAVRWVLAIFLWTFILAAVLGFMAQFMVNVLHSYFLSFLILAAVVLLGVIFDLIGTAAAAADIAPLNAKAARRVFGARRGAYLVQHADQVANFCNDVVGDISGIVSGTLVAMIVLRLIASWPYDRAELYAGILLTALVAAFTVGGKAWGKNLAINRSTEVILIVGKIITRLEKPFELFSAKRRRNN